MLPYLVKILHRHELCDAYEYCNLISYTLRPKRYDYLSLDICSIKGMCKMGLERRTLFDDIDDLVGVHFTYMSVVLSIPPPT